MPAPSWPPECCVPAFLGRAAVALTSSRADLANPTTQRVLAEACGVVLGPHRPNIWGLKVSSDPERWGVSTKRALASFGGLQRVLGGAEALTLDVTWLDEVAFGLYEDTLTALAARGGIAALAFDFGAFAKRAGCERPRRCGHHLVRLTPLAAERELAPTILSPEFRFDYDGLLRVFDDTGEIAPADALVPWQALLTAARSIVDGAIWTVLPPARGS